MAKEPEDRKKMVARMARYLGCSGSHEGPNGELMPCSTHEELVRISNRAEPKKKADVVEPAKPQRMRKGKKRRRRDNDWEELGGRGPVGIDTLPGGGLVGAAVKSTIIYGRARPRLGDPDVFTNPHAARLRARQLGCVGIARRSTPDGDTVWTPCNNNSDYRRRMGIGPQARRDRARAEEAMIRRIRRQTRLKSVRASVEGEIVGRAARRVNEKSVPVVPSVRGVEDLGRRGVRRKQSFGRTHIGDLAASRSVEMKKAKTRKPRKDRPAATPAKPSERISGSSKNPEQSAASTSSGSGIEVSAATVEALRRKVKEHNEKMRSQGKPSHSMASLGALKSVYRRGAGAFSTSHRPGMTRGRWAFARVNAYLHLLRTGKPKNPRYTTDNDLLPKGHPRKGGSKSLIRELSPGSF